MEQPELQVFVDSAIRFFDTNLAGHRITAGPVRRIIDDENFILDYTGVIEISGSKHGNIYFSAPLLLIEKILNAMGEPSVDTDLAEDLVGEIANSIAGNARSFYGTGFEMSPPRILHGVPITALAESSQSPYIIPLEWDDNTSHITVWLM